MDARGIIFLAKILVLLPWKVVVSCLQIATRATEWKALGPDLLGRVFMREAFLLADKESISQVLNPLFSWANRHLLQRQSAHQETLTYVTTLQDTSLLQCDGVIHARPRFSWLHRSSNSGPVLIYFHGGGFALEMIPISMVFLNNLSKMCPNLSIVIIDYTVTAPGAATFPLQLVEAIAIYKHFKQNLRIQDLYLMGESAGGNLVLSLLVFLQLAGECALPAKVIAISPWLNPDIPPDDEERTRMELHEKMDNLSLQGLMLFQSLYINDFTVFPQLLINIEQYWDRDIWSAIIGNTKLMLTYGTQEILRWQIARFAHNLESLRDPNFTRRGNIFVDENGCHIRPLLSCRTNLDNWMNHPGIHNIIEFLDYTD